MLPDIVSQYDMTRYQIMLDNASASLKTIIETQESFNKSSSQMKTVTLDINDLTHIGTARHIVAVIDAARKALKESEIEVLRKELKIKQKKQKLDVVDEFECEELQIDLMELNSQLEDIKAAQRGAVRRITHLIFQYNNICEILGTNVITEEMYEQDEPRYQIIRCLSQALAAARARGGLIDEGNFIYIQELGLNGAVIQREVTAFFEAEQEMLNNEQMLTFEFQYNWLQAMADKYSQETGRYIKARGLQLIVKEALAQDPMKEL